MKKTGALVILIAFVLILAGCAEKSNHGSGAFDASLESIQTSLDKVAVPDMSATILDANQDVQLKWLSDLFKFELDTMRSKLSDLTEEDLKLAKVHLMQVYNEQLADLLIEGFYQYDEETGKYRVPDTDWGMFLYDESWSYGQAVIREQTNELAWIELTGKETDDGEEHTHHFQFEIADGQLRWASKLGMTET